MKKLSVLLTLLVFLSSCIPVAVLVGATVGGAVIYDKRTTEVIVQDQRAGATLQQKILKTPELKNTHIVIATFNHIMLLAGQVSTEEQKNLVYQMATNTKYVSRVYNQITIGPVSSRWQRTKDAWITTKVKSELLAKPGLHSTEIKVVTEDGTVYLMGKLSHQQADMATDITRKIDGVRTVVKVFEYPR